jgi:ESX secretion system protein EccD
VGKVNGVVTNATADLAVSVHGPAGVLDLVVPAGAAAVDVAEAYARQSGLTTIPALCTRIGEVLPPDGPLVRQGVRPGDLLVATPGPVPAGRRPVAAEPARAVRRAGTATATALAALAGCAGVLAGFVAATGDDERLRTATVAALVAGTALALLPFGRGVGARAVAAPALAAGASLALVWDPASARLPVVLGICGLIAAVAAAAARALSRAADEALQVWIAAGAGLFVITWLTALAGAPPRVSWALLLVLVTLAARIVPSLVVDVPDQYLIDLERLAVTAWSAREQPTGKRGRTMIPPAAVAAVASRGARLLTAAATAIAVVVLVAAPLLLATATLRVDRVGARVLVGCAGAALLLAARSYRHRGARSLLRAAGIWCGVVLAVVLLPAMGETAVLALAVAAVALGVVLVLVAVATGRGWRSAWWSRRAEVAEGLAGAFVVASLVVATGWFRQLWEMTSLWELSR